MSSDQKIETKPLSAIPIIPIGLFRSSQIHKIDSGRQPDSLHENGVVVLKPGFVEGLEKLECFSHIWLIFQFHQNLHYKLKVRPPRGSQDKVGVFASRAPYRPNGIGMSAVRLISIQENILHVAGADLLDETPILDIKPYVAEIDSLQEANSGWLMSQKYDIVFSGESLVQLEWLYEMGVKNLKTFLIHQLEFNPSDSKRKRIEMKSATDGTIAYRTWRADFTIDEIQKNISIHVIRSGYRDTELAMPEDLYLDKEAHRLYRRHFSN